MEIMSSIAPVIVMLILGVVCRNTHILTAQGTAVIKKFIITVSLPATIFHAVATAEFGSDVWLVFLMMLAVCTISLLLGYLCKKAVKEPYRKYFPYIMTVYEGGMLAFPLYQNLCGESRLSNIAIIDMGVCVFSFGIYFSMLEMTDSGNPIRFKSMIRNAIKSPAFLALLFGLLFGLTGWMRAFLNHPVSEVYLNIKNILVAPLSAMILLCVGYDFRLERSRIGVCLKTVLIRFLIQSVMLASVLLLFYKRKMSSDLILGAAVYLTVTPSFCLTSFVKNEEAGKYMATTISLYMILTLISYMAIVFFKASYGL